MTINPYEPPQENPRKRGAKKYKLHLRRWFLGIILAYLSMAAIYCRDNPLFTSIFAFGIAFFGGMLLIDVLLS